MATFGENLRREREMRGVSLAEIADATKIGVRALAALESDEFDKLPGGIFTRSFIRAYAKYIGLDEEAVMAEFQLVAPTPDQADLARMNQQRPPRPPKSSRRLVIGLLTAFALLVAGYGLYRASHHLPLLRSSSQAASSGPAAAPALKPLATSSPAAPSTATAGGEPTDAANLGGAPVSSPAGQGGTDQLVLQVAATERSWVAVESDGKPVSQRIMEANEIQTFRAKSSFDLITGNGEGIILTLNGKTLDPLGHSSDVKKVHLTIDDVQNSAP
jgi:cytoskeleton protein RodZ